MPEVQIHEGRVTFSKSCRNQVCLNASLWLGTDDLAEMILGLESESQHHLLHVLAANPVFVTRLLQHVSDEQRLKVVQKVLKD